MKKYISYDMRVFVCILGAVITFMMGGICFFKGLDIKSEKVIKYDEKSNINYLVNLKENSFYEEKYLKKDMIYIASLIDSIDIEFLYNLNVAEAMDLNIEYEILARLEIIDPVDEKVYFEKKYTLLEKVKEKVLAKKNFLLEKSVTIDYDHYNNLANKFKATYGIDSKNNLLVYLKIKKKDSSGSEIFDENSEEQLLLTIPLSQKAIDIAVDYKEINNSDEVVRGAIVAINNNDLLIMGLVFAGVFAFFVVNLIKLVIAGSKRKSKYDIYVKKILTQYDRLIVESSYCPDISQFNIIKVRDILELVDVHDNLNLPIMFYELIKHQKAYFYIKNDKDIYLVVIKAVDLDEDSKR